MYSTEAERMLRVARRDLKMARRLLDPERDWCNRAEALIEQVQTLIP